MCGHWLPRSPCLADSAQAWVPEADPSAWSTITRASLGPPVLELGVPPTAPSWAALLYPDTPYFTDDVIYHLENVAYAAGVFHVVDGRDGACRCNIKASLRFIPESPQCFAANPCVCSVDGGGVVDCRAAPGQDAQHVRHSPALGPAV